jgi:hypothetical protein
MARGIKPATMAHTAAALDRWGRRRLKQRRPRVAIERIDAELITRYSVMRLKLARSGS